MGSRSSLRFNTSFIVYKLLSSGPLTVCSWIIECTHKRTPLKIHIFQSLFSGKKNGIFDARDRKEFQIPLPLRVPEFLPVLQNTKGPNRTSWQKTEKWVGSCQRHSSCKRSLTHKLLCQDKGYGQPNNTDWSTGLSHNILGIAKNVPN